MRVSVLIAFGIETEIAMVIIGLHLSTSRGAKRSQTQDSYQMEFVCCSFPEFDSH